jgi:integrase
MSNKKRFQVRFMGTTFTFDSEEDAVESQRRGKRRLGMMKRGELAVPSTVENLPLWLISDGKRGFRQTVEPGQADYEILINRYLDDRRKRVENGELSHQSYRRGRTQLELFKAYCEQANPAVTTIQQAFSEANLDAFKVWVATHSTKDRPGGFCRKPASIRDAVTTVKQMVEWVWCNRLLDEMPQNLKEFGRVNLPQSKPRTYEPDELVSLYQKARGAFKLYILLAINCGYTQFEIASLERGMVDFTTGIITRNRPKTRVKQHSKLWPITLDLLCKYAEPTGDLLLKSRDGNPLVWHKLRDDGTVRSSDCIKHGFNRLRTGITTKSFTDIRKTGASRIMLDYKRATPRLLDLYLGHSPYIGPHGEIDMGFSDLFVATDWLSTLYQWEK